MKVIVQCIDDCNYVVWLLIFLQFVILCAISMDMSVYCVLLCFLLLLMELNRTLERQHVTDNCKCHTGLWRFVTRQQGSGCIEFNVPLNAAVVKLIKLWEYYFAGRRCDQPQNLLCSGSRKCCSGIFTERLNCHVLHLLVLEVKLCSLTYLLTDWLTVVTYLMITCKCVTWCNLPAWYLHTKQNEL